VRSCGRGASTFSLFFSEIYFDYELDYYSVFIANQDIGLLQLSSAASATLFPVHVERCLMALAGHAPIAEIIKHC
jgi:hypothetical protein